MIIYTLYTIVPMFVSPEKEDHFVISTMQRMMADDAEASSRAITENVNFLNSLPSNEDHFQPFTFSWRDYYIPTHYNLSSPLWGKNNSLINIYICLSPKKTARVIMPF